eukprot:scaffold78233_cov26-Cyclotella_meneghiniana.AAC.2
MVGHTVHRTPIPHHPSHTPQSIDDQTTTAMARHPSSGCLPCLHVNTRPGLLSLGKNQNTNGNGIKKLSRSQPRDSEYNMIACNNIASRSKCR